MQRSMLAFVVAIAMVFTSGTSLAFQRGNGGGPKTGPTGAAPKGAKAQGQTASKAQGGNKAQGGHKVQAGSKARSANKAQGASKAQGSSRPQGGSKAQGVNKAQGAKTKPASGNTDSRTSVSNSNATKTGATGVETGTVTLSPVQQKLQGNTKLAAKVSGRLPAGTDLMAASAGFRNLGQFVAAVNVSNNLGIPFSQLKTRMVDDGRSLGRSIQDLRPSADHLREAQRAQSEADAMIRSTEGPPSTTSATKPTSKAKPRPGTGGGE